MNLKGKTAFITGAARRIGREIALSLAKRGVRLVLHYDRSLQEARGLQREIEREGGTAFLVKAHFGAGPVEPVLRRLMRDIFKQVRHVDILINNAAIYYPTPFGKISEKDWDQFLAVNLKTPFFLAQELGKRMAAGKSGKIINLADWTGLEPSRNYLPYAISKAGLIAATAGLAKALAPHVQVVSIAPGPILPPAGAGKKHLRKAAQLTLVKKFGAPSDIAEAVLFCVEKTDFVTGALLPVEGGAMLAR